MQTVTRPDVTRSTRTSCRWRQRFCSCKHDAGCRLVADHRGRRPTCPRARGVCAPADQRIGNTSSSALRYRRSTSRHRLTSSPHSRIGEFYPFISKRVYGAAILGPRTALGRNAFVFGSATRAYQPNIQTAWETLRLLANGVETRPGREGAQWNREQPEQTLDAGAGCRHGQRVFCETAP